MELSRRGMLAGLGVAGGGLVLGHAGVAAAEPASADVFASPMTAPSGPPPISSAPEFGVSYKFAPWSDATPFNSFASGRVFGSASGVYASTHDYLGVAFDVPPGAIAHDLEVYCSAQTATTLTLALWSSGDARLSTVVASTPVGPFPNSNLHATRIAIPASTNGPYPHGTALIAFLDTIADASIQLNGFRLGLTNVPRALVPLPAPVRVYDSRAFTNPPNGPKTPLTANVSRVLSVAVNSSGVPSGAVAVACSLLVVNAASGNGNFTIWANGVAKPQANNMVWGGTAGRFSSLAVTALDSNRQCQVLSSVKTDFVLDITGYYL